MFTLSEFNTYISLVTGTNPSRAWIEMNIEEVCMDVIEEDGSYEYLENVTLDFLINSRELDGYLSGGSVGDVDINEFDIKLDSLSMDVEGDKVTVEGRIKLRVDTSIQKMYSKYYSVNNDANLEIDMNFELNFSFNYDEDSIETQDFINHDDFDFEVTNLELTSVNIEDDEECEVEFCVLCDQRPGEYNYHTGGLVCESCMSSNDTCPDCGVVFERETMHGAYCRECEANH
ncbi:hypothetical protein JOC78_003377 [Bacillus ectoiniformans]|uniref:hypothetical protein n=1 Tax=Bacillus ectoiniformans TaxID=1494429 RepID=UPI00195E8B8E|nr:hypothetical protein [Bacillus ectoiniformans]MBM7650387.1 hypothetical protein [Bacillus ectoiniformans]